MDYYPQREGKRGVREREEIASPREWGNHGWRTATDILPPRRMRGPRAREASELPARVRQSGAIRRAGPPSQSGQATQPSGPGQPARCVKRAGFHQRVAADGPGQLARWSRRAGSTRPGRRGEAQWFSGRGGNWIGQVTKCLRLECRGKKEVGFPYELLDRFPNIHN